MVNAVSWLGVDLTGDLGTRARNRTFTRDVAQMQPRSTDRADLRDIGIAVLTGVMGALVADPEAGVALAAEAVAPAPPLEERQLAAAREGVVDNLVQSYHDAQFRGASKRELRQILSPLVPRGSRVAGVRARRSKGFSRKQMAQLGVKLSAREYRAVRLHACAFGAAATAEDDHHKPQRLDQRRLKEAVEFLFRSDNMQQVAYGSKDITFPDGTTQSVPDTLRVKCRETLYQQYARERQAARGKCWCGEKGKPGSFCYDGLSRTKFLEAADLAAKGDLKQLGALDGVAEFSGRVQFARLRELVQEVAQLCPAACGAMRQPLLERLDRVEIFIKRDLAAHLHADGADQCAEHCPQHAHGDPKSQDGARPAVCDAAHPQRCAECAELGALVEDVQVLLRTAETALTAQLQPVPAVPVAAAAAPTSADLDEGDAVLVSGLIRNVDLNGKQGTLVKWFEDDGRWKVKFDAGGAAEASLNIKPERLQRVAAASFAVGDYVTLTHAPGQTQPTCIRQLVAGDDGAQLYEVDYGFEGGTRLASAEQLQPRRSEPRLEQLRHVRELAARSTTRLQHYYAHEVRGVHEAHVMCRLLDELGDDEVILVADWKMKFLMSCFREAMSDFFGKRGMPWHGCMLVRKPLPAEAGRYGLGEYVCEYKDAMMLGSKEDGYATLCAVHLALQEYKASYPHITRCTVKTDGAAAYSGATFTLGLSFMGEMVGVRVERHFIGEAGKNKSQLDGHFAVAGEALRRLICSGLHDVRTPTDLFRGLERVLATGTTATLFEVSRTSEFEMATVQSLTLMSDREFEYDADGEFAALVLRRQSWLGDGLRMGVGALFPQGRKAPEPARAVQTSLAATSAGVARSDAGRQMQREAKATRSKRKATNRAVRQAVFEAKLRAWRSTATCFRCSDHPTGTPGCDRCYLTESGLIKHIERGRSEPTVHRCGLVRVHAAGAPIGRESGRAQLCRAVAEQASTVARHGGEGSSARPTLHAAADFSLRLCDASEWKPPAPVAGFASNQRLPSRRKSAAQLRFILFAAQDLKDKGYEPLHGHEASEVMLQMGTAAMAARWPEVAYAEATSDGLPRLPRTARLEPSELTPILKMARAAIEAKLARLRAKETAPPGEGGGEADEADEEDEDGRPTGKRKRKAGGGAGRRAPKRPKGGAVALGDKALAALRADAERPVAVADLAKAGWVPGLAKAGVEHLQSPEGWTACAALAAATPAEIAAWHAARPRGAPAVDFATQLAAALKAALAPPEAAGSQQSRDEASDAEDEDLEEEEADDVELLDELGDDELDAGEPESEEDDGSDEDEEACED